MTRHRSDDARDFLADKDRDPADLREALGGSDRVYAETLIGLLRSKDKRAKNRAAKLIAVLAGDKPPVVHAHWDELVAHAGEGDNIVRWNALTALGAVASLESPAKLKSLLPTLGNLLADESMVTAGHAIACLGRIAAAHPELRSSILKRWWSVPETSRPAECRQILLGKVIAALEPIAPNLTGREKTEIRRFLAQHETSFRPATRKLVERMMKAL